MTTDEQPRTAHRPGSHCHWCGAPYPAGTDSWPKGCSQCAEISYRNPLAVTVAVLPVNLPDGSQNLLAIRRTIEPGSGQLALPGGYLDLGETWQQAVVRELREETGIHADPGHATLVSMDSDLAGGFLCIFALLPAQDLADLPPSVPTDETAGWELLTGPTELAFGFHTAVTAAWFAGTYAHLV